MIPNPAANFSSIKNEHVIADLLVFLLACGDEGKFDVAGGDDVLSVKSNNFHFRVHVGFLHGFSSCLQNGKVVVTGGNIIKVAGSGDDILGVELDQLHFRINVSKLVHVGRPP
jgi:hypothetical protein